MNSDLETFILDANILIDFYTIDNKLLQLCNNLGNIVIPDVIIAEVNILDNSKIESFGFEIFITEIEILIEALKISESSGLSFVDSICYLLSKKNIFSCVTNDKALYNYCKRNNVNVLWGLELILKIKQNNFISIEETKKIVIQLKEQNYKITDKIIKQFFDLL